MSVAAGLGARDTIAAIATATGPGGVGIVRVSGPAARHVLETVAGRRRWEPRMLVSARARGADDRAIDEVLAVWMPGPRSFTGEDVAEIHGHGGRVNLQRLLRAALAAGARQAEPGEFTRRAFENGRLDLTQAEGLLAVIEARSERAHRLGQALLGGELGRVVRELQGSIVGELAGLEAEIDFPEQDIERVGGRRERLERCAAEVRRLVATAGAGRALRDGVSVALVGAVNAGKSSLFNCLVGTERALVAESPGTTRDYVEASVIWEGVPVTLVDTAGARGVDELVDDGLEARGIALGQARARAADLELVLVPAAELAEREGPALSRRQRLVVSKVDEVEAVAERAGAVATSAVSGLGVEALKKMVAAWATEGVAGEESAAVVSERQRSLLAEAGSALERALELLEAGGAPELVAADLGEARHRLAALLGDEIGDEMLDALFGRFCIGK